MRISKNNPTISLLWLVVLAAFVGLVSGVLGVIFHDLIAFFHNLFFAGKFSLAYDVDHHTAPSAWGAGIIFVPAIVGIAVVWLVKNFAPEAKGHGIPEVIDAVFYKEAKLRPISIWIKALSSALTIGSGGSVGREGPIVQICAAVGSTMAQWLKLSAESRWILLCAGASSGIAATFNAPIAGILFVIELFMPKITLPTLVPVCVATVVSTYLGRFWLGLHPAFNLPELRIPDVHLQDPWVLLSFIPLGLIVGLGGLLFIRLLYKTEDWFGQLFKNAYLRHIVGMLLIGLNLYLWLSFAGYYYLDGIGYSVIMELLKGEQTSFGLLFLLFFGKLIATSVTIGSGGSGGIFSPSLFFGAMLGGALGNLCNHFFPFLGLSPIVCAIAGMSAMVGSVTGLFMASIVIVVEMTGDYNSILPVMVATCFAMLMRHLLCADSVYTIKLLRRGLKIDQGLLSINECHYLQKKNVKS